MVPLDLRVPILGRCRAWFGVWVGSSPLTDDEEESGVVVEVFVSRYSAPAAAGSVEVLVVLAVLVVVVVVVVVEAVAVGAVDDGDGIVCCSEPEWDSQLAVLLIRNPRSSVAGVRARERLK
jgi:hypothetical protein